MTTRNHTPRIGLVGSEIERMLRSSEPATADSTTVNETYVATHFPRAGCVHRLWRDILDVLPEKTVHEQVEFEPQHMNIDEDVHMSEKDHLGSLVMMDRVTTTLVLLAEKAMPNITGAS